MRITAVPQLLLTALLLSSCASAPVAAPVASVAGDWYGTAEVRGLAQPLILHLRQDAAGQYSGTADVPTEVEFGTPLKSVTFKGEQLRVAVGENTFVGAVDSSGSRIEGRLDDGHDAAPLTLRPVDSTLPAFKHPQSLFYEIDGRRIHYTRVEGPSDVRIVFIHGTPGSWEGWREYLGNADLQRRATLIAVDRPGFGDSKGEVVPDLQEQARLLAPLLRGPSSSGPAPVTTLVVGHSLGGPIAAELALDDPQQVQGAVLVAPSIDPVTEVPRWYNEAMTWWAVNKLVTAFLDPELEAANVELMPLAAQLKAMEPRWKSLRMPVTVIQGEKDELVDPRTADFAERVLPPGNRVIRVPDEGHFVLWEKPAIEVDAIKSLLDQRLLAGTAQPPVVR